MRKGIVAILASLALTAAALSPSAALASVVRPSADVSAWALLAIVIAVLAFDCVLLAAAQRTNGLNQ